MDELLLTFFSKFVLTCEIGQDGFTCHSLDFPNISPHRNTQIPTINAPSRSDRGQICPNSTISTTKNFDTPNLTTPLLLPHDILFSLPITVPPHHHKEVPHLRSTLITLLPTLDSAQCVKFAQIRHYFPHFWNCASPPSLAMAAPTLSMLLHPSTATSPLIHPYAHVGSAPPSFLKQQKYFRNRRNSTRFHHF